MASNDPKTAEKISLDAKPVTPPAAGTPATAAAVAPKPAPVDAKPAPVADKPAPAAASPAPVAAKPTPVAASPAPVAAKPTPVAAKRAPVAAKPAPVAAKPTRAAAKRVSARLAPAATKVASKKVASKKIASNKVASKRVPTARIHSPAKAVTTPALASVAATSSKEKTVMATTAEKLTAKPAAMLGELNDRAKVAVEKSTRVAEDMNDFAKGNVEALVESSRIAAKGLESMGQDAAEYSRKSFESATAVLKSMASVKSPTELFKLQSDFMRTAFDSAVAEASKTTEAMLKLAGEAVQPISNRFAVAVEKVKRAA